MNVALWLLACLGVLGAFDTLYFHEWRGRLVSRRACRPELALHVVRDGLYVVVFGSLPFIAWHGAWSAVLAAVLVAEIVVTMTDFVTEDRVRVDQGGVFPGERVTHALMGIVYGAMLAFLVPTLLDWMRSPSALTLAPPAVPAALRWGLLAAAVGILIHGLRDLYAVLGLPGHTWPWGPLEQERPPERSQARAIRRSPVHARR